VAKKKPKKAPPRLEWLTARAATGDATAHVALYMAFARGRDVERDTDRAMEHLRTAASLGDSVAQLMLGREIFGEDRDEALRLFLQSAAQGNAQGQIEAGSMLFRGRFVPRDPDRGLALLRDAAARGDDEAKNLVAKAETSLAAAGRSGEENLRLAANEVGLEAKLETIRDASLPSIRLVAEAASDDEIPIGASKLGGAPDLAPGVEWPCNAAGAPLSFVAQVDLSAAPPSLLPRAGLLSFFYDAEQQPWGAPGEESSWRVLHATGTLTRTKPNAARDSYKSCKLHMFEELTLPPVRSARARALGDDGVDLDGYSELVDRFVDDYRRYPTDDGKVHRLLGHPDAIQGDMTRRITYALAEADLEHPTDALEDEARKWRLLLQIDSEDQANMMWGDLGRLYVFLREEDLASGRFERAFLQLQCT
jgi:uncharacterized protein YwqG